MAKGLQALGVRVDETDDGATILGGPFTGGEVESFGDHRVAMSLAIAGSVASGAVTVKDVDAVNTSFPGFTETMSQLGLSNR